jgi:selenocysteine lyase/cysteine desulfurase
MIYLNNAATSYPKPPSVAPALAHAVENLPGAANRGGIEDFDVMDAVRRKLAGLLGVEDHRRIGLGSNATWGLNLAIFGLGLTAGDAVVTTKAEHNSVLRPLYTLGETEGVDIHYVDTDEVGRIRVDGWTEAIETYRPKLCVFTHASNVTGAVNDVALLAAVAKRWGALVLLDCAQTLGWLDVALEEWGIDLAAFTGHKYLLGPQGTGGIYVREGIELEPHLVGGTGIRSDLDTMPDEMPLHIEAGTGNEPGAYGLLAALEWAEENPVAVGRGPIEALLESLKNSLVDMGARIIDPGKPYTPVLSFRLEGLSPDYVGELLLDSYDIIARTGLHCAPRIFEGLGCDGREGTVRVSLSRFTTPEDCEALVEAVRDIVASEQAWADS